MWAASCHTVLGFLGIQPIYNQQQAHCRFRLRNAEYDKLTPFSAFSFFTFAKTTGRAAGILPNDSPCL
jgi:hypothetical protein